MSAPSGDSRPPKRTSSASPTCIRELRRQIRPLERQASAARSYGRIADELRSLRLYLAGRELVTLSERITRAGGERDRFRSEASEMQDVLRSVDAAIEKAASDLSARDDEDLVVALGRTQGLSERCTGLSGVLAERKRSLERALLAAADVDVVSSLESDAARLVEQIAAAETEEAELVPAISAIEIRESELAEEAVGLRAMADEADCRALREQHAMANARLDAAQKAVELDRGHLRRIEEHRDSTRLRLSNLERQSNELEGQLGHIDSGIAELLVTENKAKNDLEQSDSRLRDAEHRAAAAARASDRAEARLESLSGALDELRGTAGREALSGAAGVLGALVDLVEVDPGFETAFDAALSGALSSVVVDGSRATAAVERLRHLGLSGSLLAASPRAARIIPMPPGADSMRSHVRSDTPEVARLLDRLLSGTAVVTGGWEQATELALDNPDLTYVTSEGDRFSADGWTIGVAARGLTPALVDNARSVASDARREASSAAETVVGLRSLVATAKSALEAVRAEQSEIAERRTVVERAADQANAVARALEEEIAESDPVRQDLEARIGLAVTALESQRCDLADLFDRLQATLETAATADRARAEHSTRAAEVLESRRELQVRASAIAERREVLVARMRDVEERLSGHADARRHAEARRRKIVADSLAVDRLTVLVDSHLSAVAAVADQLQELRDRQLELLRAGGARLADLRRRRHETDEKLTTARDRHQKLDIELAEVGARHQASIEALERELGCRPEDAIGTPCPEIPEGAVPERRAASSRRSSRRWAPSTRLPPRSSPPSKSATSSWSVRSTMSVDHDESSSR